MTSFFLLAALLVVAALAILVSGPLGARAASARESDLRATNISLARECQRELQLALDSDAITRDVFEAESARLESDLAVELEALPERESRDGSQATMFVVILFVPVFAGVLYLHLGDPGAVTRARNVGQQTSAQAGAPQGGVEGGARGGAQAGSAGGATAGGTGAADPAAGQASGQAANQAPALAELLPRLEERLAREPDDVDGWRLLGRSYLGIQEFKRAESSLRRAVKLDESDTDTLGQLAEAIAMGRGGELAGEPVEILDKVLEQDPAHPQGLWLRAIAFQQIGEHEAALARFEPLRSLVPDDPAALATIDDMMSRSREALGEQADTGETTVTVTIALSDAARADADADSTVFVYARATDGPPMPLAVARHTVADLPLTVTLDESMAMLPAMSLENFDSVTIGARISSTGEAIASPGDWFAEKHRIDVADDDTVELLIDERQP